MKRFQQKSVRQPRVPLHSAWFWMLPFIGICLGCHAEPAYFRANLVRYKIDETDEQVTEEQQRQIADALLAMFGDPDNPGNPFTGDGDKEDKEIEEIEKAPSPLETFGFDLEKLKVAAGPVYLDAAGNQHGLYRLHCAHCHGITGDGHGPTAPFLNPYPRDYRQGIFKFKSTFAGAKPTHEDLKRVLIDGVPGTAMPSFKLLPDNEIEALLEYVRYLSVRGQAEIALINAVSNEGELPGTIGEIAGGFPLALDEDGLPEEEPDETNIVALLMYHWADAPNLVIYPVTPPVDFEDAQQHAESIARGRTLFYSATLQCNSCHGDSAQGDGVRDKYSAWFSWREALDTNNVAADKIQQIVGEFMAVGALKPRKPNPRNLRMGVFRGGRRPIDIYRKVFSGIYGSPMPGQGTEQGIGGDKVPASEAGGSVPREQIWDVVNYVLSLQYETLSEGPTLRAGSQFTPR